MFGFAPPQSRMERLIMNIYWRMYILMISHNPKVTMGAIGKLYRIKDGNIGKPTK
jgi:hypothetical protein